MEVVEGGFYEGGVIVGGGGEGTSCGGRGDGAAYEEG